MALEIAGGVLQLARLVYVLIQENKAVQDEESELGNTCNIIVQSIQGLDNTDGNYTTALESMKHYLEEAHAILQSMKKRRDKGNKFYAMPQAQLNKLAGIQEKLMKLTQLLSMAFGAELNRQNNMASQDKADIASNLITHAAAKKFWVTKLGGKGLYEVPWNRFKAAFKREYKTNLQSSFFSNENLELLRLSLDPSGDGVVSIYEFADYTDGRGLLKAFLEQVQPPNQPFAKSQGTRDSILSRTIVVYGAYSHDFSSCNQVRCAVEEHATIIKYVRLPEGTTEDGRSGVLVEVAEVEAIPSLVVMDFSSNPSLAYRGLGVAMAMRTVDELLEEQAEKEKAEAVAGSTTQSEEHAAKLEIEMLVMAEEVEHHLEVNNNKYSAEIERIDAEMKQALAGLAVLPEHERKILEQKIIESHEMQKQAVMEEWHENEEKIKLEETNAKAAAARLCPVQFLSKLFCKSSAQVDAEFHALFHDAANDTCLGDYSCSVQEGALPRVGRLYLSKSGLRFYSVLFGSEDRKIILFSQLKCMSKTTTLMFPTALEFSFNPTADFKIPSQKMEFRGFIGRDSIFTAIETHWKAYIQETGHGRLVSSRDKVFFLEGGFNVRKEGFLIKKGDVIRNFKSRWFTLTDRVLCYAKSKDGPNIRTICLTSVGDVRVDNKHSTQTKFHFNVLTKARVWDLVAPSAHERDEWVAAIKACVAAMQVRFYFGVVSIRSQAPVPHVLEFDFERRGKEQLCLRDTNGNTKLQLPFDNLSLAKEDSENHLLFQIYPKNGSSLVLYAQTGSERRAIVELIHRILQAQQLERERKAQYDRALITKEAAEANDPSDFLIYDELLTELQNEPSQVLQKGEVWMSDALLASSRYATLESSTIFSRIVVYPNDKSVVPIDLISLTHVAMRQEGEKMLMLYSMFTGPIMLKFQSQRERDAWSSCVAAQLKQNTQPVIITTTESKMEASLPSPSASASPAPSPSHASSSSSFASPFSPALSVRSSFSPPASPLSASSASSPSSVLSSSSFSRGSSSALNKAAAASTTDLAAKQAQIDKLESELRKAKADAAKQVAELQTQLQRAEQQHRDTKRQHAEREQCMATLESKMVEVTQKHQMEIERLFSDSFRMQCAILHKGCVFFKHQRKTAPHPRYIFVDPNNHSLHWANDQAAAKKGKLRSIAFTQIRDVQKGLTTEAFDTKWAKGDLKSVCFSIISIDRTLDLQADNEGLRDLWVHLLQHLIQRGSSGVESPHSLHPPVSPPSPHSPGGFSPVSPSNGM